MKPNKCAWIICEYLKLIEMIGKQFFILKTDKWRERIKNLFYISCVNLITGQPNNREITELEYFSVSSCPGTIYR